MTQDLTRRKPDNDRFVVFDTKMREYVESLYLPDGEMDHCGMNKDAARVFHGDTWRDFWSLDRYRIEPAPSKRKELV